MLEVRIYNPGLMRSGGRTVCECLVADFSDSWLDKGLHNLVSIALSGQGVLDDLEKCPGFPAEVCADNN